VRFEGVESGNIWNNCEQNEIKIIVLFRGKALAKGKGIKLSKCLGESLRKGWNPLI